MGALGEIIAKWGRVFGKACGLWVGSESFKRKFLRLYYLSALREEKVSEMGRWVNGVWVWELKWRRDIFYREAPMIDDFISLLNKYILKENWEDLWKWNASSNEYFKMKKMYGLICGASDTARDGQGDRELLGKTWNKLTPLKATSISWKLLQGRLSTRQNLMI